LLLKDHQFESHKLTSSRPIEAYMVVNFRVRGISRGARKLARTPTLTKKKSLNFKSLKPLKGIEMLNNPNQTKRNMNIKEEVARVS
jgi:hypothetical protein